MDMICKHEYIGTERGVFVNFAGNKRNMKITKTKKPIRERR